jgi:hypothetical protein
VHRRARTMTAMAEADPSSEQWRALLTGEDASLRKVRRLWSRLPAAPRCKVCGSPFHGVGGALARLVWHGPMPDNPLLCKACFGHLSKHAGGAEIEISILFADVRGSTSLAERISASEFRALLQAYYRSTGAAIDENGGIIDKFLGDGVMALFIPVIAGENHAERAIAAGRAALLAVRRDGLAAKGLRSERASTRASPSWESSAGPRRPTSPHSATRSTWRHVWERWLGQVSSSSAAPAGNGPGLRRRQPSERSRSRAARARWRSFRWSSTLTRR